MKYLFYLLPGLLNVVLGLLFFITAKRMADVGASSLAVAATTPMWALVYALTSFAVGRILNRRNAVKILIVSQLLLLGALSGMLLAPGLKAQYFWLLLCGLGTGLFFAPFQAVVKLFEKNEISLDTFARSTAIYTFSWSFGQALGPTVAALVWGAFAIQDGWRYCYMINIGIVLLVIGCLLLMNHFIRNRLAELPSPAREETVAAAATDPATVRAAGHPDLMLSAWILGCGGFLVLPIMRVYLPDYGTKILHFPTATLGIVIAFISFAQALTALSFIRARRWPYHPYVGGLGALCGILALLMFGLSGSVAVWSAGAILLGVFSGICCFNFTYHALANAEKSARYAAVNETIVGSTSVFAPLGAGLLADHTNAIMPFFAAVLAVAIAMIGHVSLTWKYRKY